MCAYQMYIWTSLSMHTPQQTTHSLSLSLFLFSLHCLSLSLALRLWPHCWLLLNLLRRHGRAPPPAAAIAKRCCSACFSARRCPSELICPAAVAIRHRLARVAAQSAAWQPSCHVLRTVAAALSRWAVEEHYHHHRPMRLANGRRHCHRQPSLWTSLAARRGPSQCGQRRKGRAVTQGRHTLRKTRLRS